MIGQTLSHYRITEKLGEGGMGVVYKAEDTKLDRPVALKFLAAHLVSDDDVRKRFEREAKAAAGLNHPNICHVYSIDEVDGKTFIAMAFLEGEGLDKKIEAGPLKLKDALDIAIQTAQGLQAAHERGIVHRDIKPANLMVAGSGSKQLVTIMDFGLAQLADRSKLTKSGTTLGTPIYMSPEQAQGEESDQRTDIWSLGVVLYEMVVGRAAFRGDYEQAIVYSILNEQPDPMTALRTGVPMELELLVNKCLAKEADERYQHTDELLLDLQGLKKKLESGRSTIMPAVQSVGARHAVPTPSQQATGTTAQHAVPLHSGSEVSEPRRPWNFLGMVGVAAVAAVVSVVATLSLREPTAPGERPVQRFSFEVEHLRNFGRGRIGQAVVSPNGKHIAYVVSVGEPTLWIRDLDREEAREIEGTEGARFPFWSRDSEFVLFAAGGSIKRISAQGGAAATICELPYPTYFGGSQSPDGNSIVFSSGVPFQLHEVAARGGSSRQLSEPDWTGKGPSLVEPHFLPSPAGPRVLLYDKGSSGGGDLFVWDLQTEEPRVLVDGHQPVYSPTGHIIYQVEPDLWALPFSLEMLRATGDAFPIIQNGTGPSVSADGDLIYSDVVRRRHRLVWLDPQGRKQGTIGEPQTEIGGLDLSPDGRRVVVHSFEDSNTDVWVHEVDRPLKQRVTFHSGFDGSAIWSPSGKEVTFSSTREGYYDIYTRPPEGNAEPKQLLSTPSSAGASDWSLDGKYLLYTINGPNDPLDVWYLERKQDDGGFDAMPFVQTPFRETRPRFSPDGRFVAYVSNKSGRNEIYVRTFPNRDDDRQISANGGTRPLWSRDGKELFYVQGDTLMTTAVSTEPAFATGTTTPMFRHESLGSGGAGYDVRADGQRFVVAETVESEEKEPPRIHIVQNWYEEFRDREQK